MIFAYVFIFILGAAIGSFLNVLIYRLESFDKLETGDSERRKAKSEKYKIIKSIFWSRSFCPRCGHQIRWYDNIPLLSFLILRGKCRDCQGRISWQYPLVEAATGILFIAIFNFKLLILKEFLISNFQLADWVILAYLFAVFSGLFAILVYDFKHYIIPNKILYPLIILASGFGVFNVFQFSIFKFQEFILSLLIPLFFLSLIIISRGRWMGLGDVKLAVFMALFLGWPNILVAVFGAFWLGTIVSLPLLFLGKKGFKSQIPFGPFLIIGTFIAFFWGEGIISWYLGLAVTQ